MHTKSYKFLRAAGLVSATSLALLASTRLSAADLSDAFPTFDSYIKVSGQAASIKGDASAYQARTGQSGFHDGAGIEDAYYSKDLNKTTTLTVDGHALSGSEDYLLHLNLTKAELGSVDVGYKRFRTFYDGVGGFFPGNGQFSTVSQVYPGINQDLFLDRGEFWAEVKIARPDAPEFKLRYTNGTRNGLKDSTSWGATDNTGIAYKGGTYVYTYDSVRRLIPAYLDISERHQTLDGSVKHTVGKTTAEITAIGDWSNKNNGRFETAYPGEAKVVPALSPINTVGANPATGALATNWATFNNQILYSNFDRQDTTTKGINGTTLTELGPKLDLRLAIGYQDTGSTFGGDRMLITTQPVMLAGGIIAPSRQLTTWNVQGLTGNSNVDAKTGRIAFDYKPFENFTASFGVRGEDRTSGSTGKYNVVTATTVAVPVYTTTPYADASILDEHSVTPSLDLRYSGIKNLALYSTVTQKSGDGYREENYGQSTLVNYNVLKTNLNERNTDYVIGGNWRAASALTFRAEPFYKDHSYRDQGALSTYTQAGALVGVPVGGYRYSLDSQFYGVKLTAIVSPINTLTFTNRYIYQKGKMQVAADALAENDSMDSFSHTIGETIDWTPIEQFYMQGNLDVVFNRIDTVSLNSGSYLTANTNPGGPPPVDAVIPTTHNNYVTYSVLAGAVLTKKDDLQLKLTAYRATNHDAQFSTYGMSYGASMSEYTASLALKHKLTKNCIATAKVGYFDSHNDTTGGNTDFHGPLAYVSLDYGL